MRHEGIRISRCGRAPCPSSADRGRCGCEGFDMAILNPLASELKTLFLSCTVLSESARRCVGRGGLDGASSLGCGKPSSIRGARGVVGLSRSLSASRAVLVFSRVAVAGGVTGNWKLGWAWRWWAGRIVGLAMKRSGQHGRHVLNRRDWNAVARGRVCSRAVPGIGRGRI